MSETLPGDRAEPAGDPALPADRGRRRQKAVLIAVIVFVFTVGFYSLGLLLPARGQLERSRQIDASPESIYALLERPADWPTWCPWLADHEELEREGPESGQGASAVWTGPNGIESRLRIVDCEQGRRVRYELELAGEFAAHGELRVEPKDPSELGWTVELEVGYSPLARYALVARERLFGSEMERGLRQLAERVEPAEPDRDGATEDSTNEHRAPDPED